MAAPELELAPPRPLQLDAKAVPPVRVTCDAITSRHWPVPLPTLDPPLKVNAPFGM
jgi:hypothetical protein